MARVNFKASQTDFEPIPNGKYASLVESMEIKQSSKGNPMIVTTYKVQDNREGIGGRKLFENFSLLPEAGWKLKNFLEAAQVPHQSMPGVAKGEFELDFDTADCIGTLLILDVEQETYERQERGTGKPLLDANGEKILGIRNRVVGYLKA